MSAQTMEQILFLIKMALLHLKINLADYLLVIGLALIGIFIYNSFGINPTLLYGGVIFTGASIVFGFKPKPKNNGRNY